MAKTPTLATDNGVAIDKTGGPHFVLDQMCDALERAAIEARARSGDISIRWHHGDDATDGVRAFSLYRDDTEPQHGLPFEDAKAALDAMGT